MTMITFLMERKFFAGSDEKSLGKYFFMNSDCTIDVTLTSGETGSIEISLNEWKDGTVTEGVSTNRFAVVATVAETNSMTLTQPGYYALFVRSIPTAAVSSVALTDITVTWEGSKEVMRHLCLKDYNKNAPSVEGIRINGLSGMYTNNAAAINRQGAICGLQAPQETSWTDFAGNFDLVASAQDGSRSREIVNGLYEFAKPTQEIDFSMQTFVHCDGTVIIDSNYPLASKSGYLIIACKVSLTAAAQDGKFTICHSVEYQTTDVWRETSPPGADREVFAQAFDYLKQIPQFHENPLHIADVANAIKNGTRKMVRGFAKYGPGIMKGIQKYGPQVLGAAAMLL